MKRTLPIVLSLFLAVWLMQTNTALAQIGVNTTSPKLSLDVEYNNQQAALAGIRAPKVTGDFLHTQTYTAEHDGAIVFVKTPADEANQSGQTINVTCRGYYYFNAETQGGMWIPFKSCTSLLSSSEVLTKIGAQADETSVTCNITFAELENVTPALSGLIIGNLEHYRNYIDEHPDEFSTPATQDEMQAMIDKVNASVLYGVCIVKISDTESREFMCYNMGADQTLNPHDMSQANAWALNGSYIQWGRKHDMYNTQNNGAAGFVAAPSGAGDAQSNKVSISGWNSNYASNDAWNYSTNQPCPSGYRLPTKAEWDGVLANNSISKTTTNWNESSINYGSAIHFETSSGDKVLTLPASGFRYYSNGELKERGNKGFYWSSTPYSDNSNAYSLVFYSDNQRTDYYSRRTGYSVRCLKMTEAEKEEQEQDQEQNSANILEQIGNEGDHPDNVNSVVTTKQLGQIIPAITGIKNANETAYQDYIDEHPDEFSTPATQEEVQAMVGKVNAAVLYGPCIVKVSATQSKEFMCYNMGADQTLNPHDMSQPNAWALNGSYIQWGRNHDMYDTQNNGAEGFAAAPTGATEAEANKDDISGWNSNYAPNDAWNNPANQPCPSGYRLPTKAEWKGVLANNSISRTTNWNSSPTNYGSAIHFKNASGVKVLTLPAVGKHSHNTGSLYSRGYDGYYWSSTPKSNNTDAYCLIFDNSLERVKTYYRKNGYSVRCLKD